MRVDLTYNAAGMLETIQRYANVGGSSGRGLSTYTYDDAGRVQNLRHTDLNGSNLANYTYTYDAASRITTEVTDGSTKTYTYDDTNQLTADGTSTYTFDGTGNRNNGSYATGTGNRISSDGTWTYTIDAEGNETKKSKGLYQETWYYSYDHKNQLTRAEKRSADDGQPSALVLAADYSYDWWGNRTEKLVDADGNGAGGSLTTRFAQDGWASRLDPTGREMSYMGTEGWDVWADLDGSSALSARYLRGELIDQVFAEIESETSWLVTDRQGSTRKVLDKDGALKNTIAYESWGAVSSESDSNWSTRYKYTGRELDVETDLQYNRTRYYDTRLSRWTSEDPKGFDAGDSNLYRYVHNKSTMATDPSGLQFPPHNPGDPLVLNSLRPEFGPQRVIDWEERRRHSMVSDAVAKLNESLLPDTSPAPIMNQKVPAGPPTTGDFANAKYHMWYQAHGRKQELPFQRFPDLVKQFPYGPPVHKGPRSPEEMTFDPEFLYGQAVEMRDARVRRELQEWEQTRVVVFQPDQGELQPLGTIKADQVPEFAHTLRVADRPRAWYERLLSGLGNVVQIIFGALTFKKSAGASSYILFRGIEGLWADITNKDPASTKLARHLLGDDFADQVTHALNVVDLAVGLKTVPRIAQGHRFSLPLLRVGAQVGRGRRPALALSFGVSVDSIPISAKIAGRLVGTAMAGRVLIMHMSMPSPNAGGGAEGGVGPAQGDPIAPSNPLDPPAHLRGRPFRVATDPQGRQVRIYGQAEHASSTTPGHDRAMNNLVDRLVGSGEYERIHIQNSWTTVTGRTEVSRSIPDVIGVGRNGVIDAWEVRSASDTTTGLLSRLRGARSLLPREMRGTIEVIPPAP